jgi:CheY-like chemotaxis protein
MSQERKKLGHILIEQGIITAKTRDRVLQRSLADRKRFGKVLEELGLVTEEELAAALAAQYGYRLVGNLARAVVAPEVLNLLPADVAMQNLVFPLKREGNRLGLAIADPTDMRLADNLAADHHLHLVPFVASRQQIREAVSWHYLQKPLVPPGKRTVLLVDEDPAVLTLVQAALKGENYNFLTARDGMEAFRTIVSVTPQVVITDLEMPKLDGYGLLNAIRMIPEARNTPVIMLSGTMKGEEEELKAFGKGFFDVIRKPFSQGALQARVRRAFAFQAGIPIHH